MIKRGDAKINQSQKVARINFTFLKNFIKINDVRKALLGMFVTYCMFF